jgi:hypothetical protein
MERFSNLSRANKIYIHKEQKSFNNTPKGDDTQIYVEQNDISKFVSKLFESREMAHIYHLQVRGQIGSHAEHLALGVYYDSIVDLIDELVEVYQGQYEIIDGYDIINPSDTKRKKSLEYFMDLAEYIKYARKCFDIEDTHIHSLIDDIVNLIYRTTYKLKFNK